MVFITDSDLKTIIKDVYLLQVIDEDASAKDESEATAIAEVKDYLSGTYNLTAIFTAVGNARHRSIIRVTADVMLYHLHARIDPVAIPEVRRIRYEDALRWLRDVRDGKMDVAGLPMADTDGDGEPDGGFTKINSYPKFNSDY
jgi:phage gp36-like protein